MKVINVKDTVQIRDYIPRGIVVMEDIDGKIIFRKENMILEAGRKAILKSVFTTNKIEFTGLAIGKDGSGSTSDMIELNKPFTEDNGDEVIIPLKTIDYDGEENIKYDDLYILIETEKIRLENYKGGLLREIGLLIKNEKVGGDDVLFSRLSVDPTPLSAQMEYTIKYYIYF